jgi:hypothetical protein
LALFCCTLLTKARICAEPPAAVAAAAAAAAASSVAESLACLLLVDVGVLPAAALVPEEFAGVPLLTLLFALLLPALLLRSLTSRDRTCPKDWSEAVTPPDFAAEAPLAAAALALMIGTVVIVFPPYRRADAWFCAEFRQNRAAGN